MDLSINATRLQKPAPKPVVAAAIPQNANAEANSATRVIQTQASPGPSPNRQRTIDLGASTLSCSSSNRSSPSPGRKLSITNFDPFTTGIINFGAENSGFDGQQAQQQPSTAARSHAAASSPAAKAVAVKNLDASLIPDAFCDAGNQALGRKPSLNLIGQSSGSGLGDDFAGAAPSRGVSPAASVKRTRMASLPPLDPLLQAKASSLALDLDVDLPVAVTASASSLAHGSMRRLNSLNPLDGLGVEAISLSNQYIDQTGGMGIVKNTSHQPQTAVNPLSKSITDIKSESQATSTNSPSVQRKPAPPKSGLNAMPSPNLNKRASSVNEGALSTNSSPNVNRRNIAGAAATAKNVLPKIAGPADPKKVPQSENKDLVVKVVEAPVLSAREMARKRAEEKNIWRYSKMDETRRQVYFQNKMRAKELAERTRRELLKKLRRDDDDEEEDLAAPTNSFQPVKRSSVATRKREEQWQKYEKYISNIVDDTSVKQLHAYRTSFINDFTQLEGRAVKEYENYWDMRVRDINVIPKHLIKPFTMEETTNMAWDMYAYLRSIGQPLFHYDLGKVLLVIIETDWSTADKLFEIQKLFAKLPKEVFLVLKSLLTHLCRLSVSMKQDPHLFRPLSNIFAPLMFRLTARQNSIYNEEKYMAEHPSAIQYSVDSLDAECDSGDARLYDFSGDTDIASTTMEGGGSGPHAPPGSIAPTQMTSQTKRMVTPRSVITSKYSGTRASKMIEVEDLWKGNGGTTIASSNHSFEPPTMEEAITAVPGFKTEPIIRDRTVFQPDFKNMEIPKESPFNKTNLPMDDEITFREEDEFDSWVLKAMQDAANAYREKKGLPPLEVAAPTEVEAIPPDQAPPEQKTTDDAPNESTIQPTTTSASENQPETNTTTTNDPQLEKQTQYTQSSPIIPDEYQDLETFTGILLATINEMDSLLAVLDTPMQIMLSSNAFEIDRIPVVSRKSETEEVVIQCHITFLEEVDYGKGDPDGFGWNFMTKRQLAVELFVLEECQVATAALLELIIKNIDVLFEYNMHLTQERVGKMVSDERRKADDQIGRENVVRMKK
ncbi:hypothetical protein BDR26DRAFT_859495 [Obelidium mucronatum]|nr:hypothetical protein BDR26DRAFT_859495 [Obelidium mucronatum]